MLPMLRTVLASLFRTPATIPFPQASRKNPETLRGHIGIAVENCIFCGACQRGCPTGAIGVDRKEKSWTIDPFDCLACGYCVELCPKKCLVMEHPSPHAGSRAARKVTLDARIPDNA